MKYKLLYLPVDKPIIDGCILMDSSGETFPYDANAPRDLKTEHLCVAEPFLVTFEFNRAVVVGQPSPLVNWLKIGEEVKAADCEKAYISPHLPEGLVKFYKDPEPGSTVTKEVIRIKCPTCGHLH